MGDIACPVAGFKTSHGGQFWGVIPIASGDHDSDFDLIRSDLALECSMISRELVLTSNVVRLVSLDPGGRYRDRVNRMGSGVVLANDIFHLR